MTHYFPDTAPRTLLAAFTDPGHRDMQDRANSVMRREQIERTDTDALFRSECRVFPQRQLPAYIKPFVRGGLEYHEVVRWDKSTQVIEIDVQPAMLGGRARIRASYRIVADGTTAVRHYHGEVSVEVALVGGRIERAIVADMDKTMEAATDRTRAWLAQHATRR